MLTKVAEAQRGAALLLDILESEGVEYIFGNPGTTELPLMDALLAAPSIRYVLALQEASAVAMADGYAQASGRPGFLNLHTAGGLGHGMGNLLNAQISQTPLVVTVGQQDLRHSVSDPLLLGDVAGLGSVASKWAAEVVTPSQLPVLVPRAFKDAMAPPRGPVLLSLPMNVMDEMTTATVLPHSHIETRSTAGAMDRLAELLGTIDPGKLAIIAGDEVHHSGASAEVVALAEMLGAPVFGASWPSRIPFPTAHSLWSGNLPTRATDIAQRLQPYDALLALGGKSLITILYSDGPAVPAGCAVYQVSADPQDLGRTFPTPFSAIGDIAASMRILLPHLERATATTRSQRQELLREANRRRRARVELLEAKSAAVFDALPISPLVAARECVRAIGPQVPIVDEAIATSSAVREFLASDNAGQYSFLRGGALGWGMPAAVGCSLGTGRAPVVCLVGDGAALYSPQAMWTAAHERLPVTFVVMNNREYNVLKNFMRQQDHYLSQRDGKYIAMDLIDPAIDYQALAVAMGLSAQRIERPGDIAPAIEAAIASAEPNLIEIVIGV